MAAVLSTFVIVVQVLAATNLVAKVKLKDK